jgi:hypothetical protein
VTAPLAWFGSALAVLSILALGGCGTSTGSQASPTASDSLAGTGLTACPSLADVSALTDSSPAELRQAISQGASGAVGLDATADGLTASVIPDAKSLDTAVIRPAAKTDHASIYATACGQALIDDSLTITACNAQCQATSSESAKVTTWWLNRGGQWFVWNAS